MNVKTKLHYCVFSKHNGMIPNKLLCAGPMTKYLVSVYFWFLRS